MSYADHSSVSDGHRPRIYVASLADYNNGRIHGAWVHACQEPREIQNAIQRMLSRSSAPDAEEWAIHDYEGFCGVRVAENAHLVTLSQLAQGICTYGEPYAAWLSAVASGGVGSVEGFTKSYVGHFEVIMAYPSESDSDPEIETPESRTSVALDLCAAASSRGATLKIVSSTDGGAHVFT